MRPRPTPCGCDPHRACATHTVWVRPTPCGWPNTVQLANCGYTVQLAARELWVHWVRRTPCGCDPHRPISPQRVRHAAAVTPRPARAHFFFVPRKSGDEFADFFLERGKAVRTRGCFANICGFGRFCAQFGFCARFWPISAAFRSIFPRISVRAFF